MSDSQPSTLSSSKLSTLDSQLSTFNYKLLSTLNTQLSTLLIVTLAYMWLLFILSSVPGSGEGGRLMNLVSPTVANVLHVPAYGLLALLWIFTLRDYGVSEHRSMWLAFVAASGYGALTELQQFWVPGRYPSAMDVLSNIAGSLLFIALYRQGNMRFRISNFGLRVVSGSAELTVEALSRTIANLSEEKPEFERRIRQVTVLKHDPKS